jgi:hypothetical protein
MNSPNRLNRSTLRRLLRFGMLLLATGGLIIVAVLTFLPSSAAANGSLPAAQRFARLSLLGPGSAQGEREAFVPVEALPKPVVTLPDAFGIVKSLKDLPAVPFMPSTALSRPKEPELPSRDQSGLSGPDAVAQTWAGSLNMPAPIANFDGLGLADQSFNLSPPDTNGDIGYDPATGKRYYFQWVNLTYKAWDVTNPAAPTAIVATTQGNALWATALPGTACANTNDGDPIVLFDEQAHRWFISQFSLGPSGSGPFHQCVAVSQSADPAGGWYVYDYPYRDGVTYFNDYPHFGVWPDATNNAYLMTVHEFNAAGTAYLGQSASAFDRAKLLVGNSAAPLVTFALGTSYGGMLPADLDGAPPASGTPGFFFMTNPAGTLQIWEFKPDWTTPTNSILGVGVAHTANYSLAVAAYADACGTCIPQLDTAQPLDSLGDRLMHRVAFRTLNKGAIQTAVLNHTVDADGGGASTRTGIRWYEVRRDPSTGGWTLNQQSSYAPGSTDYRWMGSIATDQAGNIALGYSASSDAQYPAIRYTGRFLTDTLSTLPQTEVTMTLSTGAQTNVNGRWGDYSMMGVDPEDGCTFWYTQEYHGATADLDWKTRIGSFKFPSCYAITGALTGTVTDASTNSPLNGVTVTLDSRIATTNASGVYQFSNLPVDVYQNITASYPGYISSSAGPLTVTVDLTTTQDFALNSAPRSGCLIDTTQADFQAGTSTNCDLKSSPGDVTLVNPATLDQQNTTVGATTFSFFSAFWAGQTFQPTTSGQLTRVDLYLYCQICTGTTPDILVSIRATSGGLPTGADLATATIPGFSSSTSSFYSANFAAPPTLTAGTQYAVVFRVVSNPSAGLYSYYPSSTNVYANGERVTSSDGGSTWAASATRDLGFKTYMNTGYATSGNLVSSLKDANPASGVTPKWLTLAWNATTPASTAVKFQAAASNNPIGPFAFVGPDGTAGTYFTTTGASLSQFDGYRYLKYAAYLTTTNTLTTPTLSDVTVCFTNPAVATPTLTLGTSQNPTLIGQSVTFTASVTSGAGTPTGLVQFKANGVNLGAAQVLSGGSATLSTSALTVGTHTITADYLGDGYFGAASGTLSPGQVVTSTVTWNGNSSTDWFTASNWDIAVPTTESSAIIPIAPGGNRWPVLTGTTTIYTLTLQSSAFLTISQGVMLSVNGLVSNTGSLAQITDVPGSTTTEFLHLTDASGTVDKYHGIDLTPGVTAMGVTTVTVKGNQAACTTNPGDPIIHRCYRIDPTTQISATVRFWFTEAERNAQAANQLKLWHWSPWAQVGTDYTYSESGTACVTGSGLACWFQATSVSSYSPFALGSGNAPTAIHLTQLDAQSSTALPWLPLGVVIAIGLSVGLMALKRRKA